MIQDIAWICRPISKHRSFEAQLYFKDNYEFFWNLFDLRLNLFRHKKIFEVSFVILGDLINMDFQWNKKQDHAGICFCINILCIGFTTGIYGGHWDEEKDTWKSHEK